MLLHVHKITLFYWSLLLTVKYWQKKKVLLRYCYYPAVRPRVAIIREEAGQKDPIHPRPFMHVVKNSGLSL